MSQRNPSQVCVSVEHAARLSRYCAAYRGFLLQTLAPSVTRNQAIRATQAVQGRLIPWRAAATPCSEQSMLLTPQESTLLQQVVISLLRQQRTTRPCEQRTALIADLADTLMVLHRGGSCAEKGQRV